MPKFSFFIFPLFFLSAFQLVGQEEHTPKVYGAYVAEEEVTISWKVDCSIENFPTWAVVRYNRSAVLANEGEVWIHTDTVPYTEGSIKLS